MALPLKRTLGAMRSELQTRLGFGMSGQAGITNAPLIDSFLRSAQEWLYWQFEWRELCEAEERLTGVDQSLYDYPPGCNVERIQRIAIWNGGECCPLVEGISLEDRSVTIYDHPAKFERFDQIELWPVPNSQYRMRTEYVRELDPFEDSDHRASISSEIVFLMALTNAKAHYRQPDADRYQTQLDALLAKLKAKHRGQSVWEKAAPRTLSKTRFYSYPQR